MITRRLLVFCFWLACCTAQSPAEEMQSVKLVVRYGDGLEKHFTDISWKENITIADVLEAAKQHARGITYKTRGAGEFTLLTQIDDLENGHENKYWRYEVNGKEGDCSFVLVKLKPGDSVLWRFAKYP